MINVAYTPKHFWDAKVEGYFFLLGEKFELNGLAKHVEDTFYPHLKEILKRHKFDGKAGQVFTLSATENDKLVQFVFVGLGKVHTDPLARFESLRRGVGHIVHEMKRLEIKEGALELPDAKEYGISHDDIAAQVTTIAYLADYEFTTFKTIGKKEEFAGSLYLTKPAHGGGDYSASVNVGAIIGKATNMARQWINMPPNIMTPTALSEEVLAISREFGLKATVFGRPKALELNMGGFCSVDSGSAQDGKFVVLEYKAQSPDAPTIALVGKGVMFDTGGVSLKPAANMTGMKYDMSGAAAVFSTLKAIAQLKPDVNVVALASLVENMPSGSSNRQDDIITFMNGKTAEIKNTDAEGRLILADTLCYAEKYYKPDVIIDLATLTGACSVALGHFYTGMMTRNEKLAHKITQSSKRTGERVWPLPFDDDFIPAIKSQVADIANTGDSAYGAGTITAGLFLEHFVEKTPWAHLDIAGTADGVPGVSYLGRAGTGSGIRLLVDFVMTYKKD
jgi:leucyl aminopeptidase